MLHLKLDLSFSSGDDVDDDGDVDDGAGNDGDDGDDGDDDAFSLQLQQQ